MSRMATAALMGLMGLGLAGCAAAHRGTTVIKWESDIAESRVLKATDSGYYALYASTDVKPKVVLNVKEGQALGFEKQGDNVIAVAGENRMTYPNGTYYWNFRGKKE